ncbi:DUF3347 domain-containing protein [Sphingobacterium deserti]|nr:DUF3347 domain-containing protein [Sphingobacterium deserti]
MKLSAYIGIVAIMLLSHTTFAQIRNSKLVTVDINGNCGMCKSNIEKAGNKENEAAVIWNSKNGKASITFDGTKTNEDAILKRIALSGYDNERYLAPDEAYSALHDCCQYERSKKTEDTATADAEHTPEHKHEGRKIASNATDENHAAHSPASGLGKLITPYLEVKNALVEANKEEAVMAAKELSEALQALNSKKLPSIETAIWNTESKHLNQTLQAFQAAKSMDQQRQEFAKISSSFYKLLKADKASGALYYQFCPMYNDGKGAYWISEKSAIENPYYGSEMLSCGKTVDTL